jgi:hypothetical protein
MKEARILVIRALLCLACLLFPCMFATPITAQEAAKESLKPVVLGSGHGLDHVGVAVRDLEAAKKDYREVLGLRCSMVANIRTGREIVVPH